MTLAAWIHSEDARRTPVTVTVNQAVPAGTSQMTVGVTHIFGGIGITGQNATAKANAEALLSAATTYQCRNIYGWGLGNPNPSAGVYQWSDLDTAVTELRLLGTPVLTLCCAPGWMTAAGTTTDTEPDYSAAPTSAHYSDFATLATQIAQRYTDILYYQVWNEIRGFNWNITEYTTFYNAVYSALKAVNSNIQVGGPYINVMGGFHVDSGTDSAPIPPWQVDVLDTWLTNKTGADFINVDYSLVDYNAAVPPLWQIIAKAGNFANIVAQVKARPNYGGQPVWWAEDYFDVQQERLAYAPNDFQGACLTAMLINELTGGSAVSLRWSPGGDNDQVSGQPNIQSLFTDTRVSGGGQPYPAYYGYKAIHDHFGPSTPLVQLTSSSQNVIGIASASKILLVNTSDAAQTVTVNGKVVVSLARYQIHVMDMPN